MATTPAGMIRWRDLITGMLFVTGIAVAAVLLLVVGRNSPILYNFTNVKIFVTNVEGLVENNFVAISGRKVGTVSSMKITSKNDTVGVEVTLQIRGEFAETMTQDSKASIKGIGVLGDKFVDIELGKSNKFVKEGDFLTVVKLNGLGEITESAGKVMDNLNLVLERANRGEGSLGRLLTNSELVDKLEKSAINLERATVALNQPKGAIGKLLNDQELANKLTEVIANLDVITTDLKNGKGSAGKLLADESFYNNLNATTKRLDSLLVKLQNPNGTLGKLQNDAELYNNLNRSVLSLDTLLKDFKANPKKYINVSVF